MTDQTKETTTSADPVAHLAALERKAKEASRARSAADQALRKANDDYDRAVSAARDWGADSEKAAAAVARALSCAHDADDAHVAALAIERDAVREWLETAKDPMLAKARCACLRARLDDAVSVHAISKTKADEAARLLAEQEARHAKLADATMRARETFDTDDTKRAAFVKAKSAQDDAKIDLERARRRASDAAGIETTDLAEVHALRAELAKSETSSGMIHLHTTPIVERMRAAYAELASCHVALFELSRDMRSTLEAAGVSASAADTAPRVPDMSALRMRALDELRTKITSELESNAFQWVSR